MCIWEIKYNRTRLIRERLNWLTDLTVNSQRFISPWINFLSTIVMSAKVGDACSTIWLLNPLYSSRGRVPSTPHFHLTFGVYFGLDNPISLVCQKSQLDFKYSSGYQFHKFYVFNQSISFSSLNPFYHSRFPLFIWRNY